jgi:hypothetical protein
LSRGGGLAYPSRPSFPDARLAQLVERRPYKANVGGSIPSARTKSTTYETIEQQKSDSSKFRLSLNFSRLYRAHVSPVDWRSSERTAFSHHAAVKKIAAAISVLEHRSPVAAEEWIYNCYSAQEPIDEGLSDSFELRIFETGWSGGRATHFVAEPLFLLDHPAELTRLWASIPAEP